MGRELQKKKNRSSNPKVKHKPKSKRINPLGNPIIAANWNQKETLTQNYKRLGLTSRLNSATGGIEKLRPTGSSASKRTTDLLAISNAVPRTIEPTEARIERDPETGAILRVIHSKKRPNPLNDPLNSEDEEEEEFQGFEDGQDEAPAQTEVVRVLEEHARKAELHDKRVRKQSEREREWCARLVEVHGDNIMAMVRDRKLNPMQQTEGDIKRRISKWRGEAGD